MGQKLASSIPELIMALVNCSCSKVLKPSNAVNMAMAFNTLAFVDINGLPVLSVVTIHY